MSERPYLDPALRAAIEAQRLPYLELLRFVLEHPAPSDEPELYEGEENEED